MWSAGSVIRHDATYKIPLADDSWPSRYYEYEPGAGSRSGMGHRPAMKMADAIEIMDMAGQSRWVPVDGGWQSQPVFADLPPGTQHPDPVLAVVWIRSQGW